MTAINAATVREELERDTRISSLRLPSRPRRHLSTKRSRGRLAFARRMGGQNPLRVFPLPGFDEKERDSARSVNRKAGNTIVNTRVAAFSAVRVSAVGS
jgi:hypothetical protein